MNAATLQPSETHAARQTFRVLLSKKDTLNDALLLLVKRAKRLHVSPIIWTWGRVTPETKNIVGNVVTPARIDCHLSGNGPRLNGWHFVATLQHLPEANVVLRAGVEAVPTEYWTRGAVCDHCKAVRRRHDTYVVRHTDGRTLQIGSTCLEDFLGSDKALKAAAEATMYATAAAMAEDDGETSGGGSSSGVRSVAGYLVDVARAIRSWGWMSVSRAQETEGGISTKTELDMVLENWGKPRKLLEITEADTAKAEAALEWAETVVVGESDYLHNIQTIARAGFVERRTKGLAASIVASYDREQGKLVSARKASAVSEHFGVVGERATFSLTFESVTSWETAYGMTHLYRFRDGAGNVAIWKASRLQGELEIGKVYAVKGTVKEHGEYRNVKQTALTRCSVSL